MTPILIPLLARVSTLLSRLTSTRAGNLDFLDAAITDISAIRSIQYGTVTMSTSATATATVSAVTVAKTALIHLGVSATSTGTPADNQIRLTLTNTTTITATRVGTANGHHAAFCLVEFN